MNAKPSTAILEAVAEKISGLREFLAFTETLHKQLQLYYVVFIVILHLVADSSHCYNFLTSKEGDCHKSSDIYIVEKLWAQRLKCRLLTGKQCSGFLPAPRVVRNSVCGEKELLP